MKKYIPIIVLLLFAGLSLSAQTFSDENFIYTVTPKKAVQSGNLNTLTKDQMSQNVSYFDGLGRPVQTTAIGQGANGEDLITPVEYDGFGRQIKEYLPYAAANGGNSYPRIELLTAVNTSISFYTNYKNTSNPFSEKQLEASPLNRVLKQAAPGTSWEMSRGQEIKLKYQTNQDAEVRLFKANTSWDASLGLYGVSFLDAGSYGINELYKNVTFDENSGNTPTETGGSTVEFKNKEGQVVLKRTYDAGDKHDTYYVYDIYGNLTYVIPPKAEGVISNQMLDDLCYQYKYDNKNRLVEKKLPGKQWEFIVYDKLDRPAATGPVFSPFKDDSSIGWMITKYDAFNRSVYTGWNNQTCTSAARKAFQDAQNAAAICSETKETSGNIDAIQVYYSNNTAIKNFKLLTVNYYDNYNYPNAPTVPSQIEDQLVLSNVKSLATGSWVRTLESASSLAGETTTTFYDDKARPIRTYLQNHLAGYTITDSKLDFTGKTLYTISKHKRTSGSIELIIREEFTYSPQDRLLTHTHQVNGGAVQLMASNTYDEMGQLISKNVGNSTGSPLQKVDYNYNVRGWLTGINEIDNLQQDADPEDLFAFKINYDKPETQNPDVDPLYNGNIAETLWKTASNRPLRSYGYRYDKLNRLNDAFYRKPEDAVPNSGAYNESLSYDKNGNIKFLERNGDNDAPSIVFKIDDLTYVYENENSNKLVKVTESTAGNDNSGFIDGNKTGDDYSYDANGNMTSDKNKNITNIAYNQLNLPKKITFGTGNTIEYIYNAAGQKLSKIVTDAGVAAVTDYLGGFQYKNNNLEFFPTAEGYVKNTDGVLSYVFQYKDHLGNIRVSYAKNPQTQVLEIIEENNYYPFGLKHKGYTYEIDSNNKYKYNGKELQDELGLNMYDYGARNYDPALGRWMNIDPLAEQGRRWSPYNYAMDNPVYFIDPDGQWPTLPSWNDVKRSYNQARASVANAYSQAKSSASRTYSEAKTAVTKTYNDTKKNVVETTNKAVASTKETLKDGQKWVKDNKEQLIGVAKEIQQVGDNTTKIGLVGAVAGAPVAGVGAAPGLAVATAGGVVSFVGSGLELGVNLISGEYSTAAGDVAAHAAGEIGGMIVDKAIPGPNPDVAPEITELFKAGKKIIEGQAGDKAKGEVKKVTEQFNKE
ncbi:DUF6443 domain-containing protein [Flavobacterium sp. YO64]|uniref:DUF6443 domain-containing protein n=1 Tax=Flavobacterium sp. YO64 TaxID=394559 RepID=UPI00100A474F|nr:DUF6443 domain-containing protein [Flavobacterium sp. YO64]RXM42097.1 hypothetical protein BOW57_17810 [Flavobacterium sp. YO64]